MIYQRGTHGIWCNALTYPMKCKYCGERIYYFTCDCGCKVFFDELGYPWPVHICIPYLVEKLNYSQEKAYKLINEYSKKYDKSIPEDIKKMIGLSDMDDSLKIDQQHKKRMKEKQKRIVKVEPIPDEKIKQEGIIREIIPEIDIFEKIKLAKGTMAISYLKSEKLLHKKISQITVIVDDPKKNNYQSFTAIFDNKILDVKKIKKESIIEITLLGYDFETFNGNNIWRILKANVKDFF